MPAYQCNCFSSFIRCNPPYLLCPFFQTRLFINKFSDMWTNIQCLGEVQSSMCQKKQRCQPIFPFRYKKKCYNIFDITVLATWYSICKNFKTIIYKTGPIFRPHKSIKIQYKNVEGFQSMFYLKKKYNTYYSTYTHYKTKDKDDKRKYTE